jgi:hypothetical protein
MIVKWLSNLFVRRPNRDTIRSVGSQLIQSGSQVCGFFTVLPLIVLCYSLELPLEHGTWCQSVKLRWLHFACAISHSPTRSTLGWGLTSASCVLNLCRVVSVSKWNYSWRSFFVSAISQQRHGVHMLRDIWENQVGLKINDTHQLLAYGDGVNLLGDIIS